MDNEDPIERKRAIIDRITQGEPQNRIAKELGVSRQAINQIWTRYKEMGEYAILSPGRGRLKEKDLLTSAEKQEMIDWVKEHTPHDIGEDEERWSLKLVKRAILVRLKKRVRIPIAHGIYHTAFPGRSTPGVERKPRKARKAVTSSPKPKDKEKDKPKDKPEGPKRPPKPRKVVVPPSPSSAETDDGFPSIEEMKRINEQTVEDADIKLPSFPNKPAPGIRVGKHAKGSHSPRQKPKRRKKKR